MPRQRLEEALKQPFHALSEASKWAVVRAMARLCGSRKPLDRVYRSERPQCGARTRKGTPCKAPAVLDFAYGCYIRNGRCRMHGGLSTGPRTEAGRQRIAETSRQRMLARHAARRARQESEK